jgi:beta-galactosidase
MKINVYSHSESVKLFLNDKLIGEKTISDTSNLTASFEIPYQKGTLKAVGISNGKETGSKILATSGEVKAFVLKADRSKIKANRNDLAYITVEAVDEKGNLVPNSTAEVNIIVSGNGELLASGNASPNEMESFRHAAFKLYNGKGLVIVRPSTKPGNIEVKVLAGNSLTTKIDITTE